MCDSNGKATNWVEITWLPAAVAKAEVDQLIRFRIDEAGGGATIAGVPNDANIASNPQKSIWTKPGADPVPRKFVVHAGLDCTGNNVLDAAFAEVDAARNIAVATNRAAWDIRNRLVGTVEYDALAIVHMGTLRFDEITNRVGVWAVIDVQPRLCGSPFGTALYNQNGDLLIAADRRDLLIFDGHWQITDLLSGRPERTSGKHQLIVTGADSNKQITDLGRFVLGDSGGGLLYAGWMWM